MRNRRFDFENGSESRASSEVAISRIRFGDQLASSPVTLTVVPLNAGLGLGPPYDGVISMSSMSLSKSLNLDQSTFKRLIRRSSAVAVRTSRPEPRRMAE